MTENPGEIWHNARLALALLTVDPGLGGMHLRSRAGPLRDAVLSGTAWGRQATRITPAVTDVQLFGGIDIARTLEAGRVITTPGLLHKGGPLVATMAERLDAGLAARLSQVLDSDDAPSMVLLDEGADENEGVAASLSERVAFFVDLNGLPMQVAQEEHVPDVVTTGSVAGVSVPDDAVKALTVTAARFGISSLRVPIFALRAARAHAFLMRRTSVTSEDLQVAAGLVFAHRATCLPTQDEPLQDEPPPPEHGETATQDQAGHSEIPDEMLIDAVRSVLPDGLLAALNARRVQNGGKGQGAGQKRKGNRRGRPLPPRPGRPDGQNRIDIMATLRAAAPWQAIRRKESPRRSGLLIRPGDIHVRRFQERSDRLIIFAVDASGSSAMTRLAEAKGAVELMLAEAYARRDHVALITFRGDAAEVVLPPTRSLVQTKRRLAGVPGGGGTPLAAGLQAATLLAARSRGQGMSPSLALLTDGRANVPLPGRVGRAAATEDAEKMAQVFRAMGLPAAVVDTSVRPHRDVQTLSASLGGTYLALPRADAQGLNRAIGTVLGGP